MQSSQTRDDYQQKRALSPTNSMHNNHNYGGGNSDYYLHDNRSPKRRPERQFYIPKQQRGMHSQNSSRNTDSQYRQQDHSLSGFDNTESPHGSRAASPSKTFYNSKGSRSKHQYHTYDNRMRESRSLEPNFSASKPPRDRNNSLERSKINPGFRIPANIESLPPRLQKKFMNESGLSYELLDQYINSANRDQRQPSNYNTLPMQRNRHQRNSIRNDGPPIEYKQNNVAGVLYRPCSTSSDVGGNMDEAKSNQEYVNRHNHHRTRVFSHNQNDDNEHHQTKPQQHGRFNKRDEFSNQNGNEEDHRGARSYGNRSFQPHGEMNGSYHTRYNKFNASTENLSRHDMRRDDHHRSNISIDSYGKERTEEANQLNTELHVTENSGEFQQISHKGQANRRSRRIRKKRKNKLSAVTNNSHNGNKRHNSQSRDNSNSRRQWDNRSNNNGNFGQYNRGYRSRDSSTESNRSDFRNVSKYNWRARWNNEEYNPNRQNIPANMQQQPRNNRMRNFSNSEVGTDQGFVDEADNIVREYWQNPPWYNLSGSNNTERNQLILNLMELDKKSHAMTSNRSFLSNWKSYWELRENMKNILHTLLVNDMKFCRKDNVEQHFWNLLFHNVIDILKKQFQDDPDNKETYKQHALEIIEDGSSFFEKLLTALEEAHHFKLEDFQGVNSGRTLKGLRFVSLSLVSAQKLSLYIGDLARYREHFNEKPNYARAKMWYNKAQQLIPANGLPYNQLAIVSIYSKRKFDAIYYHMRSLMSSNPIYSAKESLKVLFDEIRKNYENNQQKLKDKSVKPKLDAATKVSNKRLRRETWIHPEGGKRLLRTSPLQPMQRMTAESSEEESIKNLDSFALNKQFVNTYLHVQGKLFTKIGMETFDEVSMNMLKQFRGLLSPSPPIFTNVRLLQLMALNMFAIENLKTNGGGRSELYDCAITLSNHMFGLILEKFTDIMKLLLSESDESTSRLTLNDDATTLLPAIKIWCDWLMCHMKEWNPPPFLDSYKCCTSGHLDVWKNCAQLMSLLEKAKTNKMMLSVEEKDGYQQIRLHEDIAFAGFAPFNGFLNDVIYCDGNEDSEFAQNTLRLQKLKFFGANLCKYEPPILKRVDKDGLTLYECVVQDLNTEPSSDLEIVLETFSDTEENELCDKTSSLNIESPVNNEDNSDLNEGSEIRKLLRLKDELERRHKMQESHKQKYQKILKEVTISLHMEVRPRYLVPDTNCFIDFLTQLQAIAHAHPLYCLMVPIVVINELEGLSRGIKPNSKLPSNASTFTMIQKVSSGGGAVGGAYNNVDNCSNTEHAAFVAKSSKFALEFLKSKHPAVKGVTTRGSILNSLTFTAEDDYVEPMSNDDKILQTAVNLCKDNNTPVEKNGAEQFIVRNVVLLTTDRNLRVKALAQNLPVRELPDFVKWSGLI